MMTSSPGDGHTVPRTKVTPEERRILLESVFTTRPEIDWARERSADGAPMRLFALHGAARIPDGFTEAHVARTGDGRPAVTFVRTRPG